MSPALAIGLFYFTFLGALGAFLPFFPLFLQEQGFAPGHISAVQAIGPLMGFVSPPLFGLLADRLRARGFMLKALSAAAALAFGGFFLAEAGPAVIYASAMGFALFRAPLWSMADASAFDCVRQHGGSFGRLRLWGTVGFMSAVLGGGLLAQGAGLRAVLVATAAVQVAAAACAMAMPTQPPQSARPVWPAWVAMLRRGDMWIFLGSVFLAQASSAAYEGFYSIHLRRLGHGERFIGVAWAIGSFAEVGLMAMSGRIVARIGAAALLALALATASARWLATSVTTAPAAVLALQPLHAVTFGCYYVAAATITRDRAAPEVATAAQGLFTAAGSLGSVLGLLVAGQVMARSGGNALFVVAAVLAAVGAAGALVYARSAARSEEAGARRAA